MQQSLDPCFSHSRRKLFRVSALAFAFGVWDSSLFAQLTSFDLTLRRDHDLPTTLGLGDCILGKLYQGAGRLSDPGRFLFDTLELPFRSELTKISCIKPGSYRGFIRVEAAADGRTPGWRIQLRDTSQTAIQIHTGNRPKDTEGCILVGTRAASGCELKAGTSVPARDTLKELYGNNNSREIVLTVLN
jgi:hypothetical protein